MFSNARVPSHSPKFKDNQFKIVSMKLKECMKQGVCFLTNELKIKI